MPQSRSSGRLGVADNACRGFGSGFSKYRSSSSDLAAVPATKRQREWWPIGPVVRPWWDAIALMVGARDTVVAAASLLPSCSDE